MEKFCEKCQRNPTELPALLFQKNDPFKAFASALDALVSSSKSTGTEQEVRFDSLEAEEYSDE